PMPSQTGESAFWIGIRALNGHYATLEGTTPLPFTAWLSGVYTGAWPVLSCVSVDPVNQYAYVPAGCGVQLPFLCQASAPDTGLSPPPSPPPPPPLGSAPTKLRRGLYLYSVYTSALPYEQAAEYCNNTGGFLASFHSANEFSAVWTALSSALNDDDSMWIGFNQLRTGEARFSWVDGGPSVYSNWGQPYTDSDGNDCAAVDRLWGDKWAATDCLERHPFACKILMGINSADAPPPQTPSPPPPPLASIPALRNFTLGGTTYWLYVPIALSFEEADALCTSYFTNLAYFDDAATFNAVMAELKADVEGVC
ncbi:hypothetical protein Vretifemale_11973, partial [Volvox reticuliferus]